MDGWCIFAKPVEEFVQECVFVCVVSLCCDPPHWRAHSNSEGLAIKANWIHAPHHEAETKALQATGWRIFMWYSWVRWTTTQQQIFLFFSPPKGSTTKACEFCFIWPCGKHMSFHVACILPRRWTAVGAIPGKASLPTWVCYNAFKQNHMSGLFPFWEVPLHPQTFCHFKHVTLMFQTHFSNVLHSI